MERWSTGWRRSAMRSTAHETPDAGEPTSGEPLPRAGDRTRTCDVQLGKRASLAQASAHQRKSGVSTPHPAVLRQPALARMLPETLLDIRSSRQKFLTYAKTSPASSVGRLTQIGAQLKATQPSEQQGSCSCRSRLRQNSPDPEGQHGPRIWQPVSMHASPCEPLLGFAGFHAVLCRTSLTQRSGRALPQANRKPFKRCTVR
jgi:hypothetical protein